MKIILSLISLTFLVNIVNGQLPLDSLTNQVVYQEVVIIDGMTSTEIYQKTKQWMLTTLKSGDNMVQLNDSTNSVLVGTGNLMLKNFTQNLGMVKILYHNCSVNFKILVEVKDGKYRYTLSNFLFTATATNNFDGKSVPFTSPLEYLKVNQSKLKIFIKIEEKFNEEVHNAADIEIRKLIASLIYAVDFSQNDDW